MQKNKKIDLLDLALFFRQLAALMTAGMPIISCCDILYKNQKNSILQKIIYAIKIEITAGYSLARCLERSPRYFNTFTCHLIQIGEQTGTLTAMLNRIALYQEKIIAIQHKIRRALFYPIVVLLIALGMSIVMLTFIVPRFAELFQTTRHKLPLFTVYIIRLSEFFKENYLLIFFFIVCVSFFIFFMLHYNKLDKFKEKLLKLPFFGKIYLKILLARFSRSLAITCAAGIPITDSLKTIAYITPNTCYTRTILKLQANIARGKQLHQSMQKYPLFPDILLQLVQIGEESGTLENMLEKAADIYEAEIDHWLNQLEHVLEPLIMGILGVLIGGLVIAMYLPIFQLGTAL